MEEMRLTVSTESKNQHSQQRLNTNSLLTWFPSLFLFQATCNQVKQCFLSPSLKYALILRDIIIASCMARLHMCVILRLWKATAKINPSCYYSRVKDLKSSQIVGCVTEKVQECIARVGLHFRDGLISWNLWHNETTVGQEQFNISWSDIMFHSLIQ